ncbi:glycosyltransferase family 9 protein [Desulfurobacterium thermolithotrophum]|uniref:glycosyltransferase family 9 protein n=1 Tax=Desulfurobacterium thermolithotrophum TaxID=64160 RepID=UPI0013D19537|nr:glycosyltransferase family 9 protein [Desulfurobacterium thermolithotrophum]
MKFLILQARNFGDAVISTALINSIGESLPDIRLDVFTRPSFKDIYKNNPYINNIYYANFPVGTNKNFDIKEFLKLLKQIYNLKKNCYEKVINNVGDFREILIGKLISPKINLSIRWEKGHIYNSLIREGLYVLTNKTITIPKDIINIYEAQIKFLKDLGCYKILPPKVFLNKKLPKVKAVGIHPLASQKCRLWQWNKWKKLVRELSPYYEVWIFCSPQERYIISQIFEKELRIENVKVKSGNLEKFFLDLSQMKLLIGLDSFSVHAAYAVGTKSIMLNGANDYRIWAPPNSTVVFRGNVCPYYPCYNKPKCIGKDFEYICMKAIEVKDVLSAVEEVLG